MNSEIRETRVQPRAHHRDPQRRGSPTACARWSMTARLKILKGMTTPDEIARMAQVERTAAESQEPLDSRQHAGLIPAHTGPRHVHDAD